MSSSALDRLPVEILHRILDHLDIQTLVLSLRYVCKRFYLITNSYNRYDLNFLSISKQEMQGICQLIPSESVIALTLSDDDPTNGQIPFFLSLIRVEQLIRLQSLTLLFISNCYLNQILPSLGSSPLKYLRIQSSIDRLQPESLSNHLSSTIARRTLRHLELHTSPEDWNRIQWPISETLCYLRIVNEITLGQFHQILTQSLCLHTLVLREVPSHSTSDDLPEDVFPRLLSLTFEDSRIDLERLDRCLSFVPSLTYLKIIGHGNLFDSAFNGYRWEALIRRRLPRLQTFEFLFSILIYSHHSFHHIEQLMMPFRAPFWLRTIQCSISCEYIAHSRRVMLYTTPICIDQFIHHADSRMIVLSNTATNTTDTDMRRVTQLELPLTKSAHNQTFIRKYEESGRVLFGNVTTLILRNDGEWPKDSSRFLSSMVHLSKIVKLSLSINFLTEHMSSLVSHLQNLFIQASNLRSLLLFDYWAPDNSFLRMRTICSLLSPNIKHLQIRVKDMEEIKCLLERLEHLTSITFEYSHMLTIKRRDFLQSLSDLDRFTSLWNSGNAFHVWLGRKK